MTAAYFAPLVNRPIIITAPGEYLTRRGERVTIKLATNAHAFKCHGQYASGQHDSWHRSGRLFATLESANDIVSAIPITT